MPRLGPWLIALIAFFAVFIDIPKHQFSFPFNCPGICFRLGENSYNQEIKTHLGLDLQGGTQLVLHMRTEESPAGGNVVDYNDRARRVIDRRINGLGVSEPVIQALGDDKILLELPGIDDIQQANEIATRQAKLEIKVPDKDKPGQYKSLEPPLTGEHLNPTFVTFDQASRPVVNFEFTGPDSDRWVQLSKDYLNQQVQITLDGKEIAAPRANTVFTFERLKEELRAGKSLRAAVEEGRRRAFPSIAYSNAATILTAAILFYFGTGTVKGFALTLGIGVAVSFFTAVIVTQMLLHGAIEFARLRRRTLYGVEERPTEAREGREPRAAAAV